jgi:hypothetical protein
MLVLFCLFFTGFAMAMTRWIIMQGRHIRKRGIENENYYWETFKKITKIWERKKE